MQKMKAVRGRSEAWEEKEEESEQLNVGQIAFLLPLSLRDPCIAALPAGAQRVQTCAHPLCCLRGDKSSLKTSQHNSALTHVGTSFSAFFKYQPLWSGCAVTVPVQHSPQG